MAKFMYVHSARQGIADASVSAFTSALFVGIRGWDI